MVVPNSTVLPGTESAASAIGRISLDEKPTGQPSAGNSHAGLDVAGAGNVAMGAGLRPTTKGVDQPPDPKVRAPALAPPRGGQPGNWLSYPDGSAYESSP